MGSFPLEFDFLPPLMKIRAKVNTMSNQKMRHYDVASLYLGKEMK